LYSNVLRGSDEKKKKKNANPLDILLAKTKGLEKIYFTVR
jgi:hypothetical protein